MVVTIARASVIDLTTVQTVIFVVQRGTDNVIDTNDGLVGNAARCVCVCVCVRVRGSCVGEGRIGVVVVVVKEGGW